MTTTKQEIDRHIHEVSEGNGCHWDDCPLAVCEAGCAGEGCQACGYGGHALNAEGLNYLASEYDYGQWEGHECSGLDCPGCKPIPMQTGQYYTSRRIDGGTSAQRVAFAEALAAAGLSDARCVMADPDLVPEVKDYDDFTTLLFLTADGQDTEDFPDEAPAYVAVLKMAEAFGVVVHD